MDDRLDDRFAEAVRGALLAEVRATTPPRRAPSRPPRRRIEPVLAGLVAAVAIIAIVVAGVSLAGLHRRADPAAPLPAPSQPFDGNCGAVLTDAAVADLAGARVAATATDPFDPAAGWTELLPLRLAGALRCGWSGTSDAQRQTGLALVIAPAATPGAVTRRYDCFSGSAGGPDQWTCGFDLVADGAWFSGFLTTSASTSEAATSAARTRLTEALTARAPAARAALPARGDGAWRATTCAALSSRAGLPRVLGEPRLTAGETGSSGETPPALSAAVRWSGQTACGAADDTAEGATPFVDIRALPAGAWMEREVAARSADRPDPEAAVRSYLDPVDHSDVGAPDTTVLWVFDGPNALRLEGTRLTDARLRAVAAALLRTLDAAR